MSEELEDSKLDIISADVPELIQEEEKFSEQQDQLLAQLLEMGFKEEEVRRVIMNGINDVESAVETITRYFENQARRISGTINCSICQGPLTQENMADLTVCLDSFCKTCLYEYLKIRIEEGQVLNMPCPNHECHSEISEFAIKSLVPPALFEKYTTFKNNEELSKNPFLRWCPKPDCKGYDIGSLQKNQLTCNVCKFNYCYYCAEPWHPAKIKCKASSEKEMDKWAKSHGLKICPNCKRKVEKTVGCDHMTCIKCRYEWCWLCGDKYSSSHYEVCEVKKLMKKNPDMKFILKMLFSPLILVFLPMVLGVVLVEKQIANGHGSYQYRKFLETKWLSYSVAIFFGLIIAPLFFAIAPIVLSVGICINCYEKMNCCHCCSIMAGFFTGVVALPVFILVAIASACIAFVLGVVLMIYKLYIFIRRCKDPLYLQPRNKYGYV